jgi:hypothetical protein
MAMTDDTFRALFGGKPRLSAAARCPAKMLSCENDARDDDAPET